MDYKLNVRMMGGFRAALGKKAFPCDEAGNKVLQVWQALLYSGHAGVHRDALSMRLYGELSKEAANSLRALVFRLRRFLDDSGLNADKCIRARGGYYHWFGPTPVIDAQLFAQAYAKAQAASPENRASALLKASELYTGRFLPDTSDSTMIAEADRLQQMYVECMEQLQVLLPEQDRTSELLDALNRACKLLPFDEQWALNRLDCLIKLDRCEEAMQVYTESVDHLANTSGIAPSDAMMARYRELSSHLRFSLSDLKTVQTDLWEQTVTSSYFCSYPSFVDCYRVASRSLLRERVSGFLMLCTLTDTNDTPLQKTNRQQAAADALKESIGLVLRGSDVYTCYSPNQFLILLMGPSAADCEKISARIRDNFSQSSAAWGCRIRFETVPATAPFHVQHGENS